MGVNLNEHDAFIDDVGIDVELLFGNGTIDRRPC